MILLLEVLFFVKCINIHNLQSQEELGLLEIFSQFKILSDVSSTQTQLQQFKLNRLDSFSNYQITYSPQRMTNQSLECGMRLLDAILLTILKRLSSIESREN